MVRSEWFGFSPFIPRDPQLGKPTPPGSRSYVAAGSRSRANHAAWWTGAACWRGGKIHAVHICTK